MKKFLSILLAAMMLFAMVGTAFADDAYTITIKKAPAGHTFEAYQIFDGKLSADGVLSDVTWGTGIDADAVEEALGKTAAELAKEMTDKGEAVAKQFAIDVAPYLSTICTKSTESGSDYVISLTKPGYYFVKDQDNSLDGDNDAYTRYMIQVVGEVQVDTKASFPSVEKKVKDANNSKDTADTENEWQDSADHDINDTVEYKLTGKLPSTLADYKTYYYCFNDTMSQGLTYDVGSAKVYVVRNNTQYKDITASATIGTTAVADGEYAGGNTLKIEFTDLLAACTDLVYTDTIVVEYTCTLNKNAVHGAAGNPNEVYLEYDNNPNVVDNNGDGKDDDDSTGKTPEDKVIVFTYKLDVNKIKPDGTSLSGAAFKLTKLVNGSWVECTLTPNSDGTEFNATGLDDGIYCLEETAAPSGYNMLERPIYFEVTAEHDEEADDPALTKLEAIEVDGSGENPTYTVLTTGKLAEFNLTASGEGVETSIRNNKGATLPSTGGIGTTLFYLFGSIMAAGSALILVVRRRAEAEEE